jgi:putative hydrolase of the HAD superfamily
MKPNIVFDMGQVLMDFAPPKFIARLGYTGEDAQALLQEVFKGWEWVAFDRGDVTGEDVVDSACSRLPARLHGAARELVFHWWEDVIPMPGAKELVTELYDKGYPLYVLSNASQDFHTYFDRIPGSEYLPRERLFVSSDHRLLKPEHEIYELFFRTYDLAPESCVFIDDNPSNVEAARRLGMQALVHRGDIRRLRRELRDLGIDVKE